MEQLFVLTEEHRKRLLLIAEQLQCVIKWNEAHEAGKDIDKIAPHLRMKEIQKELNKTK